MLGQIWGSGVSQVSDGETTVVSHVELHVPRYMFSRSHLVEDRDRTVSS